MTATAISGFTIVDEQTADGTTARYFDTIKQDMEIPFVPNLFRTAANSSNVLIGSWEAMRNIYLGTSLPMSLAAMIVFSIAAAKNCQYCSSVHKLTCKTLGIDEDTLAALDSDLLALSPERVQAIVKFAVKCAMHPQGLEEADYEAVRAQGLSDEEMMEVIGLAALGNYMDTIADALKIDVDGVIKDALAG